MTRNRKIVGPSRCFYLLHDKVKSMTLCTLQQISKVTHFADYCLRPAEC